MITRTVDECTRRNAPTSELENLQDIPKRPFGTKYNNKRLPGTTSIVALGCSSFSTFFMQQDDIGDNSQWSVDRLDPNHKIVQSWIEAIEYAICVAGITVLDTAPWYGHGTSEVVIGWAIQTLTSKGKFQREKVCINTKVGRYEAEAIRQFDYSKDATLSSVERSLSRLSCEGYIDVLQLHDPEFAPTFDILFSETIPAMLLCQKRGWCRALGLTGYPLSVQHQILDRSLQVYGKNIWDQSLTYGHYNLHDTSLFQTSKCKDISFFEYCLKNNMPVVTAAPLSMGLLSHKPPPNWHPASIALKDACNTAAEICKQHGVDISTLAILFALSNPKVPSTIIGMGSIDEVKAAHLIALRFNDIPPSLSQNEILDLVLSNTEKEALALIIDNETGPFSELWKNEANRWDGINIAHDFWKNLPDISFVDWQNHNW